MSRTVDQRVVQMEFDNADFKTKVKDTLADLKDLGQAMKLTDAFEVFKNLQGASEKTNFNGISESVDTLSNKFSMFGIIAFTAIQRVTNAVIDLGTRMVRELAIDPITQGFEEYELKLGAVQTIMASSGESLGTIAGYLDELNTYADRTIYSFSDMTQSIGKFTNAGVSLDRSVAAIQGIANEAAVSGANTNEASRAMYNFAQALSTGVIRLIDWKSIENANMATIEFKQELLDTAVALGTVKKEGDDYISVTTDMNGHVSDAFNATKAFNDSLSSQWMTSEVLVEALSHYSTDVREMTAAEVEAYEERLRGLGYTDEQITKIEELGKKAFDMAQDVKSFTQLMDTLKEAVGSGWAETFEIIFGDLDEAKKLWTGVNNVVSGFIDATASYRNEMLQYWHDTGGRADVIDGIANAFLFLKTALEPVKRAFDDVFGISARNAGMQLSILSQHFKQWTAELKTSISGDTFQAILDFFKALFNVVKTVGTVLGGVFQGALSIVLPLLRTFFDIITTAGGVLGRFVNGLTESGDAAGFLADLFKNLGQNAGNFIENFRQGLPTVMDFDGAIDSLTSKIRSLGDFIKELAGGVLTGLLDIINKVKPGISEFLSSMGIGDMFAMWNAQGLAGVGVAFALFAKTVSEFFHEAMEWGKNGGLLERFFGLGGALDNLKSTLEAFQASLNARTLLLLAGAVAALAVSVAILSMVDAPGLIKATVAVGALLTMLTVAANELSVDKNIAAAGPTMIAFGGALVLMAGALAILGHMDTGALLQGSIAIGALITGLVVAMNELAKAGPKVLAGAAAIAVVSASMLPLTAAIAILGALPADRLQQAMVALGIGLTEMAIAMKAMQSGIGGAAALAVAAAGIALLTPSLVALSLVPMENIGNALIFLGGAIAILGIGAAALQSLILPLMGLGVAFALIGVGVAGLGAGLFLVASAFQLLAVTGSAAATVVADNLLTVIRTVASAIPEIATMLAEGFANFVEALASNGIRIVEAAKTLGLALLDGFKETIPAIVETGLTIVDEFVSSLAEHLPSIIQSGVSMVVSLIEGITEGLPQIIQSAFEMAISFVNGLADAIRDNHEAMYEAGKNLFSAILEALTDLVGDILGGVADLGGNIVDTVGGWWDSLFGAGENNGEAIKKGVEEGTDGTDEVVSKALEDAEKATDDHGKDANRAASKYGGEYKSGVSTGVSGVANTIINEANAGLVGASRLNASGSGSGIGGGFKGGVGKGMSGLKTQMTNDASSAVSAAGRVSSSGAGNTVGSNFGSGMHSGMHSWISNIATKAAEMVRKAKEAANAAQNSASPAKDLIEIGGWFGEGYAIGIESMTGLVSAKAANMVESAKAPVTKYADSLSKVFDNLDLMNHSPVITPVLDLSDVEAGASRMSGLLTPMSLGVAFDTAGEIANGRALRLMPSTDAGLQNQNGDKIYNISLAYDASADATEIVYGIANAIAQTDLGGDR